MEKLTLREWVELRDVRGAVGVWSGKVAKWQEGGDETPLSSSVIYPSSTNVQHIGTPSAEKCVAVGVGGGGGYFGELVEGTGRLRIEEKDVERSREEAETCCAIAGVVTLHH